MPLWSNYNRAYSSEIGVYSNSNTHQTNTWCIPDCLLRQRRCKENTNYLSHIFNSACQIHFLCCLLLHHLYFDRINLHILNWIHYFFSPFFSFPYYFSPFLLRAIKTGNIILLVRGEFNKLFHKNKMIGYETHPKN